MVYLYDQAIVDDLTCKINDNRILITPYENLMNAIAKADGDKVQLPIISIQRLGWSLTDDPHSMKFNGEYTGTEGYDVINTYAIPIRINYLLSVWTKRQLDNDNIMRELIFHYRTHPTLQITIPYGLDAPKDFTIIFGQDIEDDSDIPEQVNIGEYRRQTIQFYVDPAYLWKSDKKPMSIIDTDGLYLNINNGNAVEKIGD